MRTRPLLALLAAIALTGGLAGCTPSSPPAADDGGTRSTEDGGAPAGESGDEASGADVTIPGTGSYVIPDEMPYGSYQLVGDPGVLPAGCSWSITGEDGAVADSNGAYVFITDIDEASTFTTNGCPDWELFE